MVVDTGLEPVTSSMSRKRASQLRQSTVVERMFSFFTSLTLCALTRWRRDLNPCTGICSPLPRLSATPPGSPNVSSSERMTGFEPATLTLARFRATNCATSARRANLAQESRKRQSEHDWLALPRGIPSRCAPFLDGGTDGDGTR